MSTRNPLSQMAIGRPLRSIEVNGQPAWTFLSSAPTQDITWQVDDATYVYLKINDGTDAAGALALANQLTFVDFETWTTRYSPDISVTGTTEPYTATDAAWSSYSARGRCLLHGTHIAQGAVLDKAHRTGRAIAITAVGGGHGGDRAL